MADDTSPAASRFYHEHLRALSPGERARIAVGLSMSVRALATAGVRRLHPDASPREIEMRVAVRFYGREVAQQVFGALPQDAR